MSTIDLTDIESLRMDFIKGELICTEFFRFYALDAETTDFQDLLPPIGALEYCDRETLSDTEVDILFGYDEPTNTSLNDELEKIQTIEKIKYELIEGDYNYFNVSVYEINEDYRGSSKVLEQIKKDVESEIRDKINEGIRLLKEQYRSSLSINGKFMESLYSIMDKLTLENENKEYDKDYRELAPDYDEAALLTNSRIYKISEKSVKRYGLSESTVNMLNQFFEGLHNKLASEISQLF